MTVAADVKNIDGMLLIPSGCALNLRQINILQAWGVNEINIQATGQSDATRDPLSRLSTEEFAQLTADVKQLFWQPDESNPAYVEVFKLVLQRRAQAIRR
jgi:hypothetical protein